MNEDLTIHDQTLILLTQKLEQDREEPDPLSMSRLGEIEAALAERGHSVGYLQTPEGRGYVQELPDGEHVQALLDRSFRLGLKAQQWTQESIELVCRTSSRYPAGLKERIGTNAPPVLYCLGDAGLLGTIQTTILLPHINHGDLTKYAERLGQAAQKLGGTTAAGADTRADKALIVAAAGSDSNIVGIVTTGLIRATADKKYQQEIAGGRLLLVSVKAPEDDRQVSEDTAQARTMIHALAGRTMLVRPGPPPSWQWADLLLASSPPATTTIQHDEAEDRAKDPAELQQEAPEDENQREEDEES